MLFKHARSVVAIGVAHVLASAASAQFMLGAPQPLFRTYGSGIYIPTYGADEYGWSAGVQVASHASISGPNGIPVIMAGPRQAEVRVVIPVLMSGVLTGDMIPFATVRALLGTFLGITLTDHQEVYSGRCRAWLNLTGPHAMPFPIDAAQKVNGNAIIGNPHETAVIARISPQRQTYVTTNGSQDVLLYIGPWVKSNALALSASHPLDRPTMLMTEAEGYYAMSLPVVLDSRPNTGFLSVSVSGSTWDTERPFTYSIIRMSDQTVIDWGMTHIPPGGETMLLTDAAPGSYDLVISSVGCLRKRTTLVVGASSPVQVDLIGGDANGDNSVNVDDFLIQSGYYGLDASDPAWVVAAESGVCPSNADFDLDDDVDVDDFGILAAGYEQQGD